jgi:iron complex transport system substrate-binding protein
VRIVCLIPSITETLLNCQLTVVGRTRFCIHPQKAVESIAVVGGTKDINWSKIDAVKPDLIILDKEENTLEMAQSCPYPYHVLHITDLDSIAVELDKLAAVVNSKPLANIAHQWRAVAAAPNKKLETNQLYDAQLLPAVIELLPSNLASNRASNNQISQPATTQPSDASTSQSKRIKYIDYMIWRDPWMAIGPNTFIWSVLQKLGFKEYLIEREQQYPNLGDKITPDDETFYLFSSEPFPFQRYKDELAQQGFQGAIIDGESYSWYGSRSLMFLQQQLNLNI